MPVDGAVEAVGDGDGVGVVGGEGPGLGVVVIGGGAGRGGQEGHGDEEERRRTAAPLEAPIHGGVRWCRERRSPIAGVGGRAGTIYV